jgi:uroporphyrinogen-III synthase
LIEGAPQSLVPLTPASTAPIRYAERGMPDSSPNTAPHDPWRVAVTRDEDSDGPLGQALRRYGFVPIGCAVVEERPPHDSSALLAAAATLQDFDWVIVSSARAVRAIASLVASTWPPGVRTAAVGMRTASLLLDYGADPPPVVADVAGAEALWERLESLDDWRHKRVLVPTVRGGRRTLIEALAREGAVVSEVEAYRMVPVPSDRIREAWHRGRPHAAVLASPSAARTLVTAIGVPALAALHAIVTIGQTTAAAVREAGLQPSVPSAPAFEDVGCHLAGIRTSLARGAPGASGDAR